MKTIVQGLLIISFASVAAQALAGSATITINDANSVNRKYDVVTDGSGTAGNYVAMSVICDQGAATNCATVATNALNVSVVNASPNGAHNTANSPTVNLATDQTAADPCMFQLKTNVAVNVATAVSVQLVGLATSKTIYVCSLSLIGSTATIFSITGGTGTACATSPTAVIGSTTATATAGLSLAANGGLTLGNGGNMIAATGSGSELCLIQSGGGVIAGNLTYVQQ